jgi:hypothetical protein
MTIEGDDHDAYPTAKDASTQFRGHRALSGLLDLADAESVRRAGRHKFRPCKELDKAASLEGKGEP